jgi:hypothetical protein
MTEKLTLLEVDALTGNEIERELTVEEKDDLATMQSELLQREQELTTKAEARTSALAKLAALGLTEEEIAAL